MNARVSRERVRVVGGPDAGTRWTCPVCGYSRVNRAGGNDQRETALRALRAHVRSSSGGDHGPRNAYPPGFDAVDLAPYVRLVD